MNSFIVTVKLAYGAETFVEVKALDVEEAFSKGLTILKAGGFAKLLPSNPRAFARIVPNNTKGFVEVRR